MPGVSDYHNLQSYPSADSLDRVYPVESTYSANYYANLGHLSPHYVHRPFATHRGAPVEAAAHIPFLDSHYGTASTFEQQHHLPPRPASSAHVMIPPHSSQPPPYSRVAVSPPPAYKMPSPHYGYDPRVGHPVADPFYPPSLPHAYLPQSEFEHPSPSSSAAGFYGGHGSRKIYGQAGMPPFRSYSPPFEPYSHETGDAFLGHGGSLMRSAEFAQTLGSYRHSPLIYATTSRNHHARSSHFHQLGAPPLRSQQMFDPQGSLASGESISPYAVGVGDRPLAPHRHHKKKKKHSHSSKPRSASSKAARSSLVHDDDDEGEDEDEIDEASQVEPSLEKSKAKVLTKSRKRRSEEKSSRRRSERTRQSDGEERGEGNEEKPAEEEEEVSMSVPEKKAAAGDDDSDSEVMDNEEAEETCGVVEDEDEDEEDTVSSNNSGICSFFVSSVTLPICVP